MEPIKREVVYEIIRVKTHNVTALGQFPLQSDSLYVEDFNAQHNVNVPVPIEVTNHIKYNVTFIVDKLSIEEIQAKPLETATMLANKLTDVFENSKINATFLKCDVKSFREVTHQSTRVTVDCSFQNVSTMEPIKREVVYEVIRVKTDSISSLGPYELQSNSLYVDDFNGQHNVNVPVPIEVTNPIEYNVTFIVGNLSIEEIQANPSETATMIANELTELFENSNINATFLKCDVKSFREVMANSTRVTADCSFQNVSTMEPIKQEVVYDVFRERTYKMTTLGQYPLQIDSLYVDGYTVQPIVIVPVEESNPTSYNVTFIVDSLSIDEIQDNPSQTATMIASELTELFKNSNVNATFLTCIVESFREEMVTCSRVTAKCLFQNVPTMEPINREDVYDIFSEMTDGISALGPYELQSNSLYVDGTYQNIPWCFPSYCICPIYSNY
ncbi:mucin-16-like isoform X1 [Leucoraja erinacea]|uniref:mucin-16-like isoform X1 n=1 Tax=Leucoraja erinaceus TaxID=7782 RepID=UPI00245393E8|nr:mucin-16-like isoform X1 [Leucoraja erinacea]